MLPLLFHAIVDYLGFSSSLIRASLKSAYSIVHHVSNSFYASMYIKTTLFAATYKYRFA